MNCQYPKWEVVDQVVLSIAEGEAALLEKPLRALNQNAHQGLEHAAKVEKP